MNKYIIKDSKGKQYLVKANSMEKAVALIHKKKANDSITKKEKTSENIEFSDSSKFSFKDGEFHIEDANSPSEVMQFLKSEGFGNYIADVEWDTYGDEDDEILIATRSGSPKQQIINALNRRWPRIDWRNDPAGITGEK